MQYDNVIEYRNRIKYNTLLYGSITLCRCVDYSVIFYCKLESVYHFLFIKKLIF